jgi:hypothetical protein
MTLIGPGPKHILNLYLKINKKCGPLPASSDVNRPFQIDARLSADWKKYLLTALPKGELIN